MRKCVMEKKYIILLLSIIRAFEVGAAFTRSDNKGFETGDFDEFMENGCNKSAVYSPSEVSCPFRNSTCCWFSKGGSSALKVGWTLSNSSSHVDIPKPRDGDGFLVLFKLNDSIKPTDNYWSPKFQLISSAVNLSISVFCGESAELDITFMPKNKGAIFIEEENSEICGINGQWLDISFDLRDFVELRDSIGETFELMLMGHIKQQPLAVRDLRLIPHEDVISTGEYTASSDVISTIEFTSDKSSTIENHSSKSETTINTFSSTETIGESSEPSTSVSLSISSTQEITTEIDTSNTPDSTATHTTLSVTALTETTAESSPGTWRPVTTESIPDTTSSPYISSTQEITTELDTSTTPDSTITYTTPSVTASNTSSLTESTGEPSPRTWRPSTTESIPDTTPSITWSTTTRDITTDPSITADWTTQTIPPTTNSSEPTMSDEVTTPSDTSSDYNSSSGTGDYNSTTPVSVSPGTTRSCPTTPVSDNRNQSNRKMDAWEIALLFIFGFFSISIALFLIVKFRPRVLRKRRQWILRKGVKTTDSIFNNGKFQDIKMKSFGNKP